MDLNVAGGLCLHLSWKFLRHHVLVLVEKYKGTDLEGKLAINLADFDRRIATSETHGGGFVL